MRLWEWNFAKGAVEQEIADVTFQAVTRSLMSGGSLLCEIEDFEMANFSTHSKYLWMPVKITNDDNDYNIWEGWVVNTVPSRNKVMLEGLDGMRLLDRVWCPHDSLITSGFVTAVGANYIDDENAAFDSRVQDKYVQLTDKESVETEVVFPNSNSNITGSPSDPQGVWSDMGDVNGRYGYSDDTSAAQDAFAVEIHFTCPNYATSERLEFFFTGYFEKDRWYSTYPQVEIYDYDTPGWVSASADMEGEGRFASWGKYTTLNIFQLIVHTNVGRYLDNSGNCKVRILSGETSGIADHTTLIPFANVENFYTALFNAELEIYTVDSYTNTRLTFTGQTPSADGIGTNDIYRVGEEVSQVMKDLWNAANVVYLTLDVDVSNPLLMDATDHHQHYVGQVIRPFAQRMNREIFHKQGWIVSCKTALTSTGITLTEDDLFPNWLLPISGEHLARRIVVFGANNLIVKHTNAPYPVLYDKIITDAHLTTQAMALDYATALAAIHDNPLDSLIFKLDFDDGNDYSALDIGKTSTVNLYSGEKILTNATIKELSWIQHAGDNLKVDMEIGVY